jgi:hypothetical protein
MGTVPTSQGAKENCDEKIAYIPLFFVATAGLISARVKKSAKERNGFIAGGETGGAIRRENEKR